MQPKWSAAAPYAEGAISALTDYLARQSKLERNFVPDDTFPRAVAATIKFLPGRQSASVAARLARKGTSSLYDVRVAPLMQPRRLFSKIAPRVARGLSRDEIGPLKDMFDHAVARHLLKSPSAPAVFVGMPSASLHSFAALEGRSIRVFHEVDAPPRALNQILRHHYPNDNLDRELVNDAAVRRIEEEIYCSDLVLVPSRVVESQIRMLRPDVPILRVPYAVNLQQFKPLYRGFSRARPRILFVGQISFRKGIPALLSAAQNLQVDIDLVGPVVQPELLSSLPSNVRYRGVAPHSSLARLLSNADALVLPSVEDNFALILLEALAAGLPLITTEVVGAVDVLPTEDRILCAPGDVVSLREALLNVQMLADDDRAERAARVRAIAGLTGGWDYYSAAVVNGVEHLLNG